MRLEVGEGPSLRVVAPGNGGVVGALVEARFLDNERALSADAIELVLLLLGKLKAALLLGLKLLLHLAQADELLALELSELVFDVLRPEIEDVLAVHDLGNLVKPPLWVVEEIPLPAINALVRLVHVVPELFLLLKLGDALLSLIVLAQGVRDHSGTTIGISARNREI